MNKNTETNINNNQNLDNIITRYDLLENKKQSIQETKYKNTKLYKHFYNLGKQISNTKEGKDFFNLAQILFINPNITQLQKFSNDTHYLGRILGEYNILSKLIYPFINTTSINNNLNNTDFINNLLGEDNE